MKYLILMRRPGTPQANWRLVPGARTPFDTADQAQAWIDANPPRDPTWEFHITQVAA